MQLPKLTQVVNGASRIWTQILPLLKLKFLTIMLPTVAVQTLSPAQLFATPCTAARHASLRSLSPRVYSNSCPLSQGCHPTISSSVSHFSSCPQSFPESGSFPMSWLFSKDNEIKEDKPKKRRAERQNLNTSTDWEWGRASSRKLSLTNPKSSGMHPALQKVICLHTQVRVHTPTLSWQICKTKAATDPGMGKRKWACKNHYETKPGIERQKTWGLYRLVSTSWPIF